MGQRASPALQLRPHAAAQRSPTQHSLSLGAELRCALTPGLLEGARPAAGAQRRDLTLESGDALQLVSFLEGQRGRKICFSCSGQMGVNQRPELQPLPLHPSVALGASPTGAMQPPNGFFLTSPSSVCTTRLGRLLWAAAQQWWQTTPLVSPAWCSSLNASALEKSIRIPPQHLNISDLSI